MRRIEGPDIYKVDFRNNSQEANEIDIRANIYMKSWPELVYSLERPDVLVEVVTVYSCLACLVKQTGIRVAKFDTLGTVHSTILPQIQQVFRVFGQAR